MPVRWIPAAARRLRPWSVLSGVVLALALFAPVPVCADAPDAPQWTHDEVLDSPDGYTQLAWGLEAADDDVAWVYHLQEGREPVFDDTQAKYMGTQHSSFMSGLDDGTYYYRVRARRPDSDEWSPWSSVVRVDVHHHDRSLALGLMAIGGVVFLVTAAFLIRHRNDPVPTGAPGGAA